MPNLTNSNLSPEEKAKLKEDLEAMYSAEPEPSTKGLVTKEDEFDRAFAGTGETTALSENKVAELEDKGFSPEEIRQAYQPGAEEATAQKLYDRQDGMEMAGRVLWGGTKTGLATAVENFAYMLDVPQWANLYNDVDKGYSNFLAESMAAFKADDRAQYPIYSQEFGDAGWFAQGTQSTVESGWGFGIPGGIIGKGLGRAGKMANMMLKSKAFDPNNVGRVTNLMTAFATNYAESMLMANEMQQNIYNDAIKKGIGHDEALLEAGEQSRKFIRTNKINTIADYALLQGVLGGAGRIHGQGAAQKSWKEAGKAMIMAAPKEAAEEYSSSFFQKEGERRGAMNLGIKQDDKSSILSRAGDHLVSEEGMTEGFFGAFGGVSQHVTTKLVGKATSYGAKKLGIGQGPTHPGEFQATELNEPVTPRPTPHDHHNVEASLLFEDSYGDYVANNYPDGVPEGVDTRKEFDEAVATIEKFNEENEQWEQYDERVKQEDARRKEHENEVKAYEDYTKAQEDYENLGKTKTTKAQLEELFANQSKLLASYEDAVLTNNVAEMRDIEDKMFEALFLRHMKKGTAFENEGSLHTQLEAYANDTNQTDETRAIANRYLEQLPELRADYDKAVKKHSHAGTVDLAFITKTRLKNTNRMLGDLNSKISLEQQKVAQAVEGLTNSTVTSSDLELITLKQELIELNKIKKRLEKEWSIKEQLVIEKRTAEIESKIEAIKDLDSEAVATGTVDQKTIEEHAKIEELTELIKSRAEAFVAHEMYSKMDKLMENGKFNEAVKKDNFDYLIGKLNEAESVKQLAFIGGISSAMPISKENAKKLEKAFEAKKESIIQKDAELLAEYERLAKQHENTVSAKRELVGSLIDSAVELSDKQVQLDNIEDLRNNQVELRNAIQALDHVIDAFDNKKFISATDSEILKKKRLELVKLVDKRDVLIGRLKFFTNELDKAILNNSDNKQSVVNKVKKLEKELKALKLDIKNSRKALLESSPVTNMVKTAKLKQATLRSDLKSDVVLNQYYDQLIKLVENNKKIVDDKSNVVNLLDDQSKRLVSEASEIASQLDIIRNKEFYEKVDNGEDVSSAELEVVADDKAEGAVTPETSQASSQATQDSANAASTAAENNLNNDKPVDSSLINGSIEITDNIDIVPVTKSDQDEVKGVPGNMSYPSATDGKMSHHSNMAEWLETTPDVNKVGMTVKLTITEDELNQDYVKESADYTKVIHDYFNGRKLSANQIQILPIRMTVLDAKGNPVIHEGKEVFGYMSASDNVNFTSKERSDLVADRIRVINSLKNGKPVTASITKVGYGQFKYDKTLRRNVQEATGISSASAIRILTSDGKRLVVNNLEEDRIDKNIVFNGSAPGLVFMSIKALNGETIPIKLNSSKLNVAEAEIVFEALSQMGVKDGPSMNTEVTGIDGVSGLTYKQLIDLLIFEGKATRTKSKPFHFDVKAKKLIMGDDLANPIPFDQIQNEKVRIEMYLQSMLRVTDSKKTNRPFSKGGITKTFTLLGNTYNPNESYNKFLLETNGVTTSGNFHNNRAMTNPFVEISPASTWDYGKKAEDNRTADEKKADTEYSSSQQATQEELDKVGEAQNPPSQFGGEENQAVVNQADLLDLLNGDTNTTTEEDVVTPQTKDEIDLAFETIPELENAVYDTLNFDIDQVNYADRAKKYKEFGITKSDGTEITEQDIANDPTFYQKFSHDSIEDSIASEKTIRDLAERMADRIGGYSYESWKVLHFDQKTEKQAQKILRNSTMFFDFINDKTKNFKGTLTTKGYPKQTAVINLAYATLDTPIHEILGHPIIRALKTGTTQNKQLYNNLLKELETGKGKEVLDRVKRDYDFKNKDKINQFLQPHSKTFGYDNVRYYWNEKTNKLQVLRTGEEVSKEQLDVIINKLKSEGAYTLEEQQEEAIVELLGLYTADKLNKIEDGKLISLLKRLLKEMKAFMRSLLNQKEVNIDKLSDDMTLGDIADLFAYSNSKLILPGNEVKYTTPDNKTFKTYQEASNHISELVKLDEVDLNDSELLNNQKATYTVIDGETGEPQESGLIKEDAESLISKLNEKLDKFGPPYIMELDDNPIKYFIDKNREYEQTKEIIEEWKKANEIEYDPEEIYSRGQGFYSVVGAYSDFDVELMFQNLLSHIEDSKTAGGEFTISAFTKPVNKKLEHLEGGGGKIRFKIFPESEDIKWAANADVYSGSVWDAAKHVDSNKNSENIGVSYTKTPSLEGVFSVQPNLANIIENLDYHHNELGVELTGNNFRLEYDNDIPNPTKKLLDNVNKILDSKYGKLVEPKIESVSTSWTTVSKKEAYEAKEKGKFIKEGVFEYEWYLYTIDEQEDLGPFGDPDDNTYAKKFFGKHPTQTKDNLKTTINNILVANKPSVEDSDGMGNYGYDADGFRYVHSEDDEYFKTNDNFKTRVTISAKEYHDNKPWIREFSNQAEINTKIAALKEGYRKFPRSLIRSEVVPFKQSEKDLDAQFFQLVGDKELTPKQQLESKIKKQIAKDLYSKYLATTTDPTVDGFKKWESATKANSKTKDVVVGDPAEGALTAEQLAAQKEQVKTFLANFDHFSTQDLTKLIDNKDIIKMGPEYVQGVKDKIKDRMSNKPKDSSQGSTEDSIKAAEEIEAQKAADEKANFDKNIAQFSDKSIEQLETILSNKAFVEKFPQYIPVINSLLEAKRNATDVTTEEANDEEVNEEINTIDTSSKKVLEEEGSEKVAELRSKKKGSNNKRITRFSKIDYQSKMVDAISEKKELAKILPYVPVNIVNGLLTMPGGFAEGKYYNKLITLSDVGNVGVAYHEAFHAVSDLYLTKDMRAKLYQEIINSSDELKALPISEAIAKAEEVLAEDFRAYMADKGTYTKKEGVWGWLMDQIRRLVNLFNDDKTKIFNKIREGRYNYSPSSASASTLYSGIPLAGAMKQQIVKGIAYEALSMSGHLSLDVDAQYEKIDDLFDEVHDFFVGVHQQAIDEKLHSIARHYSQMFKYWDKFAAMAKTELISYNFDLDVAIDTVDEDSKASNLNITSALERSGKKNASGNTKLMVEMLPAVEMIDGELEPVSNEYFGRSMMTLADSSQTWNLLENTLSGIQDLSQDNTTEEGKVQQQMFNRIKSLSETHHYLKNLVDTLASEDTPLFKKTQFYRTFNNESIFYTMSIGELAASGDFHMKIGNADVQNKASQIINKMGESFYLKFTNNGELNEAGKARLVEALDKYNKLDAFAQKAKGTQEVKDTDIKFFHQTLLKAGFNYKLETVGMYIDSFGATAQMQNFRNAVYSLDKIFDEIKTAITDGKLKEASNKNFFTNHKELRDLADIEGLTSLLPGESMVRGKDGKTYWTKSLRNHKTRQLAKLKANPAILQDMLESTYHNKSKWLQKLKESVKDGTADRIYMQVFISNSLDGENVDSKIENDYKDLNGMPETVERMNRVLLGASGKNRSIYPMLTLGDSSTWYQMAGMEFHRFNGVSQPAVDHFYEYALTEIGRISAHKTNPDNTIAAYNAGKKPNAAKSFWFKELSFGGAFAEKIDLYTKDGNLNLIGNENLIKEHIKEVLIERAKDEFKNLRKAGVIKNFKDSYSIVGLDSQIRNAYGLLDDSLSKRDRDEAITHLITDYSLNSMIANIESSMMFYGDPAFYSDVTKRVKAASTPGTETLWVDGEKTTFNLLVLADIEKKSTLYGTYEKHFTGKKLDKEALAPYLNINVADAQGYITPARFKSIMRGIGLWNDEVHGKIYDKLIDDKHDFTEKDKKDLQDMYKDAGIPHGQPLKGMYYGFRKKGNLQVPVFVKYSQAVLWPSMIKGLKIEKLANKMIADGIDESVHISGVKVGAENIVDINDFLNNDGADFESTPMTLDSSNWSLVQELSSKYAKGKDVLTPSQARKNIIANMVGKTIKLTTPIKGLPEMNGEEVAKLINDVESALSNIGVDKLKEEFGLDPNGNLVNKNKLYNSLYKQLVRDKVSNNVIEAIQRQDPLDTLFQFIEPLETRLLSKITDETVKLKSPGGAFIQISNSGFERAIADNKVEGYKTLADMPITSRNGIMWFTDGQELLGPSIDSKGKVKMGEVLLPYRAVELIPGIREKIASGKFTGSDLKLLMGDTLEGLIGCRIPNQDLPSSDALQIAGILPPSAGDSVVTFTEVVGKTGADFDVDKMFVLMPNVVWNGKKLMKIAPDMKTELGLQNMRLVLWSSILTSPDMFSSLVSPVDSQFLKEDAYYVELLSEVAKAKQEGNLDELLKDIGVKSIKELLDSKKKSIGLDYLKTKSLKSLEFATPSHQQLLKERNMAGLIGTAQVADQLAHHPIAQHVKLALNIDLFDQGSNTRFDKDLNEDDVLITRVLSAYLNANVDNAKDPFISFINNNTVTVNAVMIMLKSGISPTLVNRFISQPIIKAYVENKGKVKNPFNSNTPVAYTTIAMNKAGELQSMDKKNAPLDAVMMTLQDFKFKSGSDIILENPSVTKYSVRQLEEMIINNNPIEQVKILTEFLKYEHFGKKLTEVVSSSKADTKGARGSSAEGIVAASKIESIKKEGNFENYDKIFSDTMIGTMHRNSVEFSNRLFGKLLISQSPKAIANVKNIFAQSGFDYVSDTKLATKILRSFRSYVYSGAEQFNVTQEEYVALTAGKTSIANQMVTVQNRNALKDNYFIQSLSFKTVDGKTTIILPSSKSRTQHETDLLWQDFEKMFNVSGEEALGNQPLNKAGTYTVRMFADKLLKYAFITSGFEKSMLSYHDLIPSSVMSGDQMGADKQSFTEYIKDQHADELSKDIASKRFTDQFYRHEGDNDALVPSIYVSAKMINSRIVRPMSSTNGSITREGFVIKADALPAKLIDNTESGHGVPKNYIKRKFKMDDGTFITHLYKYIGMNGSNVYYEAVSKLGFNKKGVKFVEYSSTSDVVRSNMNPNKIGVSAGIKSKLDLAATISHDSQSKPLGLVEGTSAFTFKNLKDITFRIKSEYIKGKGYAFTVNATKGGVTREMNNLLAEDKASIRHMAIDYLRNLGFNKINDSFDNNC